MKLDSPWYLSARAIREYLALTHRADDDGGPLWAAAERELAEMATRILASGGQLGKRRGERGDLVYYRGPKPQRFQLIVSTTPRQEGPLPQLVSVTAGNAVAASRKR